MLQSPYWPAQTVPIVLLPGGDQGLRVLELARSWVQLGLLGPALWVSPEDVDLVQGAPPVILARVLRLQPDRELVELSRDLFEVLARDELRQVRVLKVRSATPRREIDVIQDDIAESVSRYVKHSVPSADPKQSVSDQQTLLTEATLICAPTEFQVSERVAWATDDPGLIVVASPEDRSSPWSGDAFVRDNDRFVGFCLMHLATVAGIWNAVPVGSFDLFSQEASMHHSIWISRVFVNAVMMDGFARRVAAGILADAADGNAELVDASISVPPTGTAFIPEERRAHYVQRVVDGIFAIERAQLDYSPAEVFTTREKERVSFPEQLASFASFSLDKVSAMPGWLWRGVRIRASKTATATFHSDEGLAVVGIDPAKFDIRDRSLVLQRERLAAEILSAQVAAAGLDETGAVRSTPGLWERLREVMFGVLDGSADLTDVGFLPIEDKTPIFSRVADLVQPPDDRWEFPDADRPEDIPHSIGLEDLESADNVLMAVRSWALAADGLITERDQDCSRSALEIAALESRRTELAVLLFEYDLVELDDQGNATIIKGKRAPSPKTTAVDLDGDLPPNLVAAKREFIELPRLLSAATRRLVASEVLRDGALEERQRRHGIVEDLERWVAGHQTSIYGQIVARMTGRRERAIADLVSAEDALESVELPEPGRLIALRQSFHKGFAIATTITLVILGLYFVIENSIPGTVRAPWWPQAWQATAIAAGAIVFTLVVMLLRYHRGWSRIERQIAVLGDRLEWAVATVRHTRRELRRMEVLHRQASEWLRLLAECLHHPWSVDEDWLARSVPSVDRSTLPYAMRLAVTIDDDPAPAGRMKREAARVLMVKGWRARAFARLVEEIRLRLGYDPSTLGLEALDTDLPHASNHARRILMEHASDSEVLRAVATAYLQEIVAEVQGASLTHSSPKVVMIAADPLDDDGGTVERDLVRRRSLVEWGDFLLDAVSSRPNPVTPIGSLGIAEMALADAHHESVQSYVLLPDRLKSDIAGMDAQSLKVTTYPDSGVRSLDLVLRVDVAGPVPVSAARLWERANSKPRKSVTEPTRDARAGL